MTTGPAGVLDLVVGVATDVGLRRAINEDSVLAEFPVFAVADGMGGHDAGDRASRAVVDALRALAGHDVSTGDVEAAIGSAHRIVGDLAARMEHGAGSTLTGVIVVGGQWLVVNIGDSRVYRSGVDGLEQLTVDHSVVQQLVDDGLLAREDVGSFPGRNVITRAVGADDSEPDLQLVPIIAGERLLVCSDGLTGEVDEPAIAKVLTEVAEPQAAADELVRLALAAGGHDNVTVLVVEVRSAPDTDLDDTTIEIPR